MGGLNSTFATYCLWTCPLWNIFKNIFYKKVLYLVGEYILNFCPESENFYFLENMLIFIFLTLKKNLTDNFICSYMCISDTFG